MIRPFSVLTRLTSRRFVIPATIATGVVLSAAMLRPGTSSAPAGTTRPRFDAWGDPLPPTPAELKAFYDGLEALKKQREQLPHGDLFRPVDPSRRIVDEFGSPVAPDPVALKKFQDQMKAFQDKRRSLPFSKRLSGNHP